MNKPDQQTPDERAWQEAFENASETPPPRVWASIERRLDEPNKPKILPLWGAGLTSMSVVRWSAGIAATLAFVLGGWWFAQPDAPAAPTGLSVAPVASAAERPDVATKSAAVSTGAVASAATRPNSAGADQRAHQPVGESVAIPRRNQPAEQSALAGATPTNRPAAALAVERTHRSQTAPLLVRALPASVRPEPSFITTEPLAERPLFMAVADVRGKSFRHRSNLTIQRIVWVAPADAAVSAAQRLETRRTRAAWVSAAVMPAVFNPSVALRFAGQPTFASNAAYLPNAVSTGQPVVSSRPDVSVAYQVGAGLQVGERWSVESGVGYLAGRSTVDSPTSAAASLVAAPALNSGYNPTNAPTGTLYTDALTGKWSGGQVNAQSADRVYNLNRLTTYYSGSARQTLTNDYQYVQVPMQVGYQLRPRKRLGLALLGGFLTNLFVRNTVGNDVIVTSRDGVYRPVSWAATMGVRVRYRPTRRWSASLAGVYQPSLSAGTRSDASVLSRPTTSGISFGLDYHFD